MLECPMGEPPAISTVEQREHREPEKERNISCQTLAEQAGLGKVDLAGIENNGGTGNPDTDQPE
jgi:hypothetical protein